MRTTRAFLVAIAAVAGVTSANAVEFTIGIGPGVAPDYQGSDDYGLVPFVTASARNLYHPETHVSLSATRLYSNLVPHSNWRLGPYAEYNFGREDVDDRQVDAMRDVDGELSLGLTGGYDFDPNPRSEFAILLDVMKSVGDDQGALARTRVQFSRPWNEKFSYSVGLETNYGDDDHMETFFGVNAADSARSGLAEHDADAGFKTVGLNLGGNYRFTDHWSLSLAVRLERLLGDAADSPVVDDRGDENQFYGFTSINYRF